MQYEYKPEGVCSNGISYELDNGVLRNVHFSGGCRGNLTAISNLLEGMNAQEAIEKLRGITCRPNGASCADQLAQALAKSLQG